MCGMVSFRLRRRNTKGTPDFKHQNAGRSHPAGRARAKGGAFFDTRLLRDTLGREDEDARC
jgi:hypothetical protein